MVFVDPFTARTYSQRFFFFFGSFERCVRSFSRSFAVLNCSIQLNTNVYKKKNRDIFHTRTYGNLVYTENNDKSFTIENANLSGV